MVRAPYAGIRKPTEEKLKPDRCVLSGWLQICGSSHHNCYSLTHSLAAFYFLSSTKTLARVSVTRFSALLLLPTDLANLR